MVRYDFSLQKLAQEMHTVFNTKSFICLLHFSL